ncbi:MAG: V-type ATP synthase subunit I [Candidatus Micrarchaeia archaeon]
MLRTAEMQKLRVIALKEYKKDIIKRLQALGLMSIESVDLPLENDVQEPEQEISAQLARVESAISIMEKFDSKKKRVKKAETRLEEHKPLAELLHECSNSKEITELFEINSNISGINENIKRLESAEEIAQNALGFDIVFPLPKIEGIKYKFVTGGKADIQKALEKLKGKPNIEVEAYTSKSSYLFVMYAESEQHLVESAFAGISFKDMDTSNSLLSGRPKEAIKKLEKEKESLAKELNENLARIESIKERYMEKILALKEMLMIESERAQISGQFKTTEQTFIIEGWAEKKNASEIKREIEKTAKGKCVVEEIEKKEGELAPTKLTRKGAFAPFDYIMEMYSLPRSDEIDPTWIFILSFVIFYGLMISDAGYGIASIILSAWIAKKVDKEGLMYNAAKIWEFSGFSAVIFGIMSNQYFGYSLNGLIGIPTIFIWQKNITQLMLITIIFGIVEVALGLVFGFINNYRFAKAEKSRKELKVAYGKLSSLAMMVSGIIAVAGGIFGIFSYQVTMFATAISIACFILTIVLSGSEASEITSLMSHPLSFARIFGFGLSSVIITMLIDSAFPISLKEGWSIVIFALLLAITQFMNLILSMLEAIIQATRLNVAEFFSKFYKGNGIKFEPFYYKRKYTYEKF